MEPRLTTSARRLRAVLFESLPRDLLTPGAVDEALRTVGACQFTVRGEAGGLGFGETGLALLAEQLGARLADARPVDTTLLAVDVTLTGREIAMEDVIQAAGHADGSHLWLDETIADLLARARCRHGAWLLGVATRAHLEALRRAVRRSISDRRLLEYQAVAHSLARQRIDIAATRAHVWRAADTFDAGTDDAPARAGVALAVAIDTSLTTTRKAAQVFGAAGSSEPAVSRAYMLVHTLANRWGAPAVLWQHVAELEDRRPKP